MQYQVFKSSSVDYKPSAIVALATSPDDLRIAAARDDGSVEIWLVSPGAVAWHCQLVITQFFFNFFWLILWFCEFFVFWGWLVEFMCFCRRFLEILIREFRRWFGVIRVDLSRLAGCFLRVLMVRFPSGTFSSWDRRYCCFDYLLMCIIH